LGNNIKGTIMKKFINKIEKEGSLLESVNYNEITSSIEVTPDVITAYDPTDIQVLNDAGFIEYEPEYVTNRRAEYPGIEECIHAILDDDLTALQIKRQAVKDAYPKPQGE